MNKPGEASTITDSASTFPPVSKETFQHKADMYLGEIWNRMEAELRGREGDGFEYDVSMRNGCLLLKLPGGGGLKVCKVPNEESLQVETTLSAMTGEMTDQPDPRQTSAFAYDQEKGGFVDAQQRKLHSFLEQALSRHLQVKLNLSPKTGAQ